MRVSYVLAFLASAAGVAAVPMQASNDESASAFLAAGEQELGVMVPVVPAAHEPYQQGLATTETRTRDLEAEMATVTAAPLVNLEARLHWPHRHTHTQDTHGLPLIPIQKKPGITDLAPGEHWIPWVSQWVTKIAGEGIPTTSSTSVPNIPHIHPCFDPADKGVCMEATHTADAQKFDKRSLGPENAALISEAAMAVASDDDGNTPGGSETSQPRSVLAAEVTAMPPQPIAVPAMPSAVGPMLAVDTTLVKLPAKPSSLEETAEDPAADEAEQKKPHHHGDKGAKLPQDGESEVSPRGGEDRSPEVV